MSSDFDRRLDLILERVTSDTFLNSQGLGNEIPFYAFDYEPEFEPKVQAHLQFLLQQIPKRRPGIRLGHVDLLALVIAMLEKRGYYEKTTQMQEAKGNDAAAKALKGPLKAEKVAQAFVEAVPPDDHDLVLVSGIGSAYPMVRLHNLLNNLHPLMKSTPLVFFYPGVYDGQSLRLFGLMDDKPYYRAFRLVD